MSETSKPSSVLFVCNMNAIRSPMAEYLARDICGTSTTFQSAGAQAGYVDPFMPFIMQERGIGFEFHESKDLVDFDLSEFDLIVTLTPQAHHVTLEAIRDESCEIEYWPTENPAQVAGNREQVLDSFRKVRNTLEDKIKSRFCE